MGGRGRESEWEQGEGVGEGGRGGRGRKGRKSE